MTFTIAETKTTPFAEFREGNLVIKGKSVPFEKPIIFNIINRKLINYSKNPKNKTQVDFTLSAVNAISKRYIISILKLLEGLNRNGDDIAVNWYYHPDDEDILEFGEICQSICNINIQLKKLSK